jgi:hypothetical protein
MKILVTNNTLGAVGGSETYAYTLIMELIRQGHDVEAMSASSLGTVAQKLLEKKVNVTTKPSSPEYELILASHISSWDKISSTKGLKIQTCHGPYHHLEQPYIGFDKHVSVSEEVQTHLKKLGIESPIIHNGVDVERFKPTTPINGSVKTILSLSQFGQFNTRLKGICDRMGIKLLTLNKFANPVFNVEDYINEADMVISIGRGVYESMACGRVVLCLDQRQYIGSIPIGDGVVTPDNIKELLRFNCTGRLTRTQYDDAKIISAIKSYDKSLGEFGREFATKELNIAHQVEKYLALK